VYVVRCFFCRGHHHRRPAPVTRLAALSLAAVGPHNAASAPAKRVQSTLEAMVRPRPGPQGVMDEFVFYFNYLLLFIYFYFYINFFVAQSRVLRVFFRSIFL